MSTTIDLPGFADPVRDAQACFRAILGAMARPGSLHRLPLGLTPPGPLDPATAAVLLTLLDGEASLAVTPAFRPAAPWIGFHCGIAVTAGAAGFVLADALPDLATLDAGSDECPEASTTVILQVPALGSGTGYVLAGPGLEHPTAFAAGGLPADFVALWAANHGLYPRGVDLILCAGETIAALPRTTRIGGV